MRKIATYLRDLALTLVGLGVLLGAAIANYWHQAWSL